MTLGGVSNRHMYNGKELVSELNLGWLNYGARYMDPSIGRFISVDPLASKMPDCRSCWMRF